MTEHLSTVVLPVLASICSEYVTPKLAFNRQQFRDMWLSANVRYTDLIAIEQMLSYIPLPLPACTAARAFDEDAYIKWEAARVKQLDMPVVVPPSDYYCVHSTDPSDAKVLKTAQCIEGYRLQTDGLELTEEMDYITNADDAVTFRVLFEDFYRSRRWKHGRIMGLDLVGVDERTGYPVFGLADLS